MNADDEQLATGDRERVALIGRERELDEISGHVDIAAAGNGALTLIAGEPGLGKSHLLDEVARNAASRDLRVISSRCWEGQRSLPLSIWMHVARELSAIGLVTHSNSHRPFALAATDAAIGLLGDVDPAGARARWFDRIVTDLRRAVTEWPLLIALDDLQWADRSSLDLLGQLASSCRDAPLAIVGAYRDTEVGEALDGFLGMLPSDTGRVTLTGLTAEEVGTLASTVSGAAVDADLVATLTQHTAGNPFFVKELMRLLIAQGRLSGDGAGLPAGVREVLSRRIARLRARCREALGIAAVIGSTFDTDLIATVLGAPPASVVDLLDEAVQARVVMETGSNRHHFVHDLFRQAFYDGLGGTHRLKLHLAVGEALESRHRRELEPHLGAVAHHFLASVAVGDRVKAADYGRRAGERAAAMFAFDEAVACFERALDANPAMTASDRAGLLVALGDARWRGHDLAEARNALKAAAELARTADDGPVFAKVALAYGGGLGGNQPLASADMVLIGLLEEALNRLPPDDDPVRCRVMGRLAVELALTDASTRRAELSAAALEMARRLDDPSCLATAHYARQIAMFGPDGVDERQAAVEEMLALAARVGDRELALWGHLFRLWVLAERCQPIDAELSVCADLADQLGLPAYRAEVAMRQAINRLIAGDFDGADRLMDVVHATQAADLVAGTTQAALDAMTGALSGPYEELAKLVDAIVAEQPEKVMWRAGLAVIYVEMGQLDDARRVFDQIAASGFDVPRDGLWLFAMHMLGFACFGLGDADRAAALHDLLAPHADKGTVAAFGSMATPFGLMNAALGDFDEAFRWLDTGWQRNLAIGNRAYALWSRRETAAVLLARGTPDDVRRARVVIDDVLPQLRIAGFSGFVPRAEHLATLAETAVRSIDARRTGELCELRQEAGSWMATFDGETKPLRASKGIDDIAELLDRPQTEVAAVELAGVVVANDTGDVLDARALREVRSRLADLEQDVADAERIGDLGRAERIRAERDTLTAALTSAVGLGGRHRRTGDIRERARKTVTWRIRQAIKTVLDEHPRLGRHLDQSVRTGTFCTYAPDTPRRWCVVHRSPAHPVARS